ncbi:Peptidoglycan-binding domain 1 protein [Kribbella flavida DSM 17836]|uniref:Peptidoglycan-binding domain 1 protein n=1 Tax=Kribbella flavida (strain DSM 17836 / JCM 10339 / NBRC 14399) TaxID=479435 RepID=D2PW03_KRIFD|nr:peptidoglycan-binding protein [Kribbella flavida]ADB29660.1 Peptidoglycan-binding domain 1 protein [Kribbella flavida DSM 17836]
MSRPAGTARQRRLGVAGVAGLLLVAAAAVVVLRPGGSSGRTVAAADQPPATTAVVKTTLTQTVQISGTLSYGVPQALKAPPGGGTLTWLPGEGSTVGFGAPAYRVDNVPVLLIKGTVPLYKTLEQGVSGPDVLQLEQYLVSGGWLKVKANTTFGSATTAAVLDWQDATGQPETGQVKPGQLVVRPVPIRVAVQEAQIGDQLGGGTPLYTFSTTQPKVVVGLDVAKQHLVKKGLTATVVLPTGQQVPGTVSSVSKVATQPAAGSDDPPHVPVVVTPDNLGAISGLDSAPVDVELVSAQQKGVLAVPVNALVALAEGGYGVQVVTGGQAAFVAVQLGMFAGGKVEVSGPGITAGTLVGVPA